MPPEAPTFAEAGAEEDADAEGGDTDIAVVDDGPPRAADSGVQEEGVNMVTHE